jgi:hypothetical protein
MVERMDGGMVVARDKRFTVLEDGYRRDDFCYLSQVLSASKGWSPVRHLSEGRRRTRLNQWAPDQAGNRANLPLASCKLAGRDTFYSYFVIHFL